MYPTYYPLLRILPAWGLLIGPNDYDEEDSSLALTMPSLTKLGVYDPQIRLSYFFRTFDSPSLQEFEYRFDRSGIPPGSPPPELLNPFLSRAHALTKLTLVATDFTRDRLILLLRHCPKVTFLSLSIDRDDYCGQTVDDDFLEPFVSPDEDGQYLCPRLEEWLCRGPTRFTDEGILKFITRKQDGSQPQIAKLKRMHIAFNRIHVVDISGKTEGFVEDGLDLQLSYSPDDIEAFAREL